jgi:hypothetical protein
LNLKSLYLYSNRRGFMQNTAAPNASIIRHFRFRKLVYFSKFPVGIVNPDQQLQSGTMQKRNITLGVLNKGHQCLLFC